MPYYSIQHVHHETTDVTASVEFYKDFFGATAGDPFERGGADWVEVQIGNIQVTVTNRDSSAVDLVRLKGLDHFALTTDDFDATMADIESKGINIWFGPVALENGKRIVFISGPDNIKIELMEK